MDTEKLVSFGFVVDATDASDTVKVFNFETGQQQDSRKNMLRLMPDHRQRDLKENENMMAIQRIILDKGEVAHKLACNVPCDPGEEVTYRGGLYHIVTCDGTVARIENEVETVDVHMKELGRGRVDHINSWNYRPSTNMEEEDEMLGAHDEATIYPESVKSGFNSSSRSVIHKGQWVWIPVRAKTAQVYPDSKKELGVIMVINGAIVVGYYAVDGIRFDTHISQIVAVHIERQEWLNEHKSFFKFKTYAVTGDYLVKSFALGRDFHLICVGLAKLSGILVDEGTTYGVSTSAGNIEADIYSDNRGVTRDGLTQADMSERDRHDAKLALTRKGVSFHTAEGAIQTAEKPAASNNTMMLVVGGVLALGVIYYLAN